MTQTLLWLCELDPLAWDRTLATLPGAHALQTSEWGQVKRQTGWLARPWLAFSAGEPWVAALFLRRALPGGLIGIGYVPKGPALDYADPTARSEALAYLEAHARRRHCLFVKIDPDLDLDSETGQATVAELRHRGWVPSAEQIQFRNTMLLDLSGSEDDWLARMHPKTRYNIRLAARKGVSIRAGKLNELHAFYTLYAETGARDHFLIRPFPYYEETWRTFLTPREDPEPSGVLLLAEVAGTIVAGAILFRFAGRAWYMYGASTSQHRELMPNYALQWEAMRWAATQGCTVYDLWGAPDELNEQDPMWGVYRFKQGFGARLVRGLGAWDYPTVPALYWAYTRIMPKVIDFMHRRHRTEVSVAGG